MKRLWQTVGLILSLCILALAQETRGSLSGIVSDGSGAGIPRANLQLTNTETGVVLTTVSNRAGLYRFPFLNPGKSNLVASIAGSKTSVRYRHKHSDSRPG